MTNTPGKAPKRAYSARSPAGLGMGSHKTLQTILGPLIAFV